MAYEQIEQHLLALGIAVLGGGTHAATPDDDPVWRQIGPQQGAYVPSVVRWLVARFGGFAFPEGGYYFDPHLDKDVEVGWFLRHEELLETFAATRDSLPADILPITNDGGDNHLAVGIGPMNAGIVYVHIHDAPTDKNLYWASDSIEAFLCLLHGERADRHAS